MTAKSGIFDTRSKSLEVTLIDTDRDGWPDIIVASDTQPNKLYRNLRNGKFEEIALYRAWPSAKMVERVPVRESMQPIREFRRPGPGDHKL